MIRKYGYMVGWLIADLDQCKWIKRRKDNLNKHLLHVLVQVAVDVDAHLNGLLSVYLANGNHNQSITKQKKIENTTGEQNSFFYFFLWCRLLLFADVLSASRRMESYANFDVFVEKESIDKVMKKDFIVV